MRLQLKILPHLITLEFLFSQLSIYVNKTDKLTSNKQGNECDLSPDITAIVSTVCTLFMCIR